MKNRTHVVVLPYYCDQEVSRYLQIGKRLKDFPQPECSVHFLLANSPRREPDPRLLECFSEIGPCTCYSCPTQVFGYPEGPTAMYWDAMEYVAANFTGSDGFCLWLESDMAPVKEDWIDRLSEEWYAGSPPLMMGCYVPDIYKKRIFRKPKLILNAHINGGACYAMDFARRLPANARSGVFDMAVFEHALQQNGVRETVQIAFSTLARVRRDVQSPDKVLLHGFMQDKDQFIDACLRPVTPQERRNAVWHPLLENVEQWKRSIRVQFIRRGHRAMLENMLLTKQKVDRNVA